MPSLQHAIRQLRRLAREQGYLTLEQVRALPAVAVRSEWTEVVVERLQEEGFVVVEDYRQAMDDGRGGDVEDIISLYMRSVAQEPLLTATEEVELAQAIESGEEARGRLRTLATDDPRRPSLAARLERGERARERFVKANTRLVISVARRYTGQGVPLLDLIQEGNLGLMRAVERFDWRRGFKFSTYATWWVRQSVARGVANQGRTIRVPAHVCDRLRQLHRARQHLYQRHGREPAPDELAAELEIPPEEVSWLWDVSRQPISLDQPLGEEDEEDSLAEVVAERDEPPPAEVADRALLSDDVEVLLRSLSAREARILELRFGLCGCRPHTLREVGRKFGLTRERIRQIEKDALARLRRPGRTVHLRDYVPEA